jgi:F0F1-type ATP synthase membrane subunit b/b'
VTKNDFNRKVGETAERIETEANEFIKYLNDEVVPAVRQHSTKALRIASEKLEQLADYMEKHQTPGK